MLHSTVGTVRGAARVRGGFQVPGRRPPSPQAPLVCVEVPHRVGPRTDIECREMNMVPHVGECSAIRRGERQVSIAEALGRLRGDMLRIGRATFSAGSFRPVGARSTPPSRGFTLYLAARGRTPVRQEQRRSLAYLDHGAAGKQGCNHALPEPLCVNDMSLLPAALADSEFFYQKPRLLAGKVSTTL